MENKVFVRKLKKLEACTDAVEWVTEHGGAASDCWRDCQRGDWMAWLAAKTKSITRRQLVGALADCAALSLKYFEAEFPSDRRVRDCLEVCWSYSRGSATDKELASAAYAAAYAASAAASAAYAAAAASAAAYAAASAASAATDAAYAAAYAADAYAAYAAARDETLSQCAEIFRKAFPELFKEPE